MNMEKFKEFDNGFYEADKHFSESLKKLHHANRAFAEPWTREFWDTAPEVILYFHKYILLKQFVENGDDLKEDLLDVANEFKKYLERYSQLIDKLSLSLNECCKDMKK